MAVNKTVFAWFAMWMVQPVIVLAVIFTWWGRLMILTWITMSFFVAPPHEWLAFRDFIEKHFGEGAHDFFPLSLHAEDFWAGLSKYHGPGSGQKVEDDGRRTIDGKRAPPLLFNICPHGIMSVHVNFLVNLSGLWTKEKLPRIRPLIGTGFFFLPIAREYHTWMGNFPVSQKTVRHAFKHKLDLALVPGGFEEAVLAHPGTNELFMSRNLGWIKHAMRGGYGVVPVFSFGENELYDTWQGFKLARAAFAGRTRIPMIVAYFHKRFFPPRHPIALVVGEPVWFPRIEDPTKEQVQKCYGLYVEAVRAHYEKHKASHGAADIPFVSY